METLFNIVNIVTGIITVASVIVRYTTTEKDDLAIGKIKRYLMPVLEAFSINGSKAKK